MCVSGYGQATDFTLINSRDRTRYSKVFPKSLEYILEYVGCKTIKQKEVPQILRWFDDQRLAKHGGLYERGPMALLGNISPSLYDDWFVQIGCQFVILKSSSNE